MNKSLIISIPLQNLLFFSFWGLEISPASPNLMESNLFARPSNNVILRLHATGFLILPSHSWKGNIPDNVTLKYHEIINFSQSNENFYFAEWNKRSLSVVYVKDILLSASHDCFLCLLFFLNSQRVKVSMY